jgi:hypothetical protein
MPYDAKDPRASLAAVTAAEPKMPADYAGTGYVKFYELDPDETSAGVKTWYGRGQNMIISYSETEAGKAFPRKNQSDEYILLLPDRSMSVEVTTKDGVKKVDGFTLSIVPPGDSSIKPLVKGRIFRFFSIKSEDLAEKCSNAQSYATPHPNVTLFEPWPAPPAGLKLRTYSLDVPKEQGRFGRIFRCTTFMVNFLDEQIGPRDHKKMSPHVHDDFEQCSLAVEGTFVHHIRWPWITDMTKWRQDEHVECATPSIAVITATSIHTTGAVDKGLNQLVDIFCPPRLDFSQKKGWVLNAAEYPMP